MIIQVLLIGAVVFGWLIGTLKSRHQGLINTLSGGLIGALVGGTLVSLLVIAAGGVDESNTIAALIAFACAVILVAIRHLVARLRTA